MIKARLLSANGIGLIAPLLFGSLAFYIVVGPKAFDPTNLEWINGIDPIQHYLGWAFYRFGPWTLPLGLNPQFGLEISSSIVFSDSIPLVAILLKPFSAWLPDPFQYLGLWVYICLVLQGYFGFLLMSLMTQKLALKILGMGLLVFAPPMLWRIGLHAALVSHFLILAAFYLALSTRTPKHVWGWIILLLITAMIHVYLLLMVLCIWFGQLLDGLWSSKSLTLKQVSVQTLLMFGLLGLCLWQVGYFALALGAAATSDLYGGWGLNIASFVDPQGWSYIKNIWPSVTGNAESFFYFGLGIIFMALFFLFTLPFNIGLFFQSIKHHRFLIASLFALLLFAITNQVTIGTGRFTFNLPSSWIENYASIFRLSARLAWPIWYLLVLLILYGVIKRFSYKQACAILGLALVLQIFDTSSGYLAMRARNQAPQDLRFGQPSPSNFWQQAAARYRNLRFFPLHSDPLPQSHWQSLASYAARYHLATNDVYLSRLDGEKVKAANHQFHQQLQQGSLDLNTLYVFDDTNIANVRPYIDRRRDYLAKIDGGLSVLAPNWKTCPNCPLDESEKAADLLLIKPALGQRIAFTAFDVGGQIVGWGWAKPEAWGVWAKDSNAVITFLLPNDAQTMLFEFNAFVFPAHPQQRIKIRINDQYEQLITLIQAQNNQVKIHLPPYLRENFIQVEFEFLDAIRPKDFGIGEDRRKLAAALLAITFQ